MTQEELRTAIAYMRSPTAMDDDNYLCFEKHMEIILVAAESLLDMDEKHAELEKFSK